MRRDLLVLVAMTMGCGNKPTSATSDRASAPQAASASSSQAASAGDSHATSDMPTVDSNSTAPVDPLSTNVRATASDTHGRGTPERTTMRCTLRISAMGIYVDGDPTPRDKAVVACKRAAGAVVILDDGLPADVWAELRGALRREGVPILMRGPVNDIECADNPLAKGCP